MMKNRDDAAVMVVRDTGPYSSTLSRSWLPALQPEVLVMQGVGPMEIRWTMESPGKALDEVTLRVDFIGWAREPVDFDVFELDSDWITLGRGLMFRIYLSEDLRLVESAQTALSIVFSGVDF